MLKFLECGVTRDESTCGLTAPICMYTFSGSKSFGVIAVFCIMTTFSVFPFTLQQCFSCCVKRKDDQISAMVRECSMFVVVLL